MILIGSNGIGKTTLPLELIVGIFGTQKGIIKLTTISSKTCLKKKKNFTYLPHKDGLKENLTILENIKIGIISTSE